MASAATRQVFGFLARALIVVCAALIGVFLFAALVRFGGEFLGHNSFTATAFAAFMTWYCLLGWMRAMAPGHRDRWSVVLLLTVFLPFSVPAFAFYIVVRVCRGGRMGENVRRGSQREQ
jgi:hypothetical protein